MQGSTKRSRPGCAGAAGPAYLALALAGGGPRRQKSFTFRWSTTSSPNGLRVVLSQDHTPLRQCAWGVYYYRIGFRIEPKEPHWLRAPLRTHDVPGFEESGEKWNSSS